MQRDLRDPTALGKLLLFEQSAQRPHVNLKLSFVADYMSADVVDYDANPSCIEKYGRPQDLPSTMP